MRPIVRALLILFLSINAAHAQELLLKNAQVVDPVGRTITRAAIVIHDGRIAQIFRDPVDAFAGFEGKVIDLDGKWVIPGLNDMHVHSFGNIAPGNQLQLMGTEEAAKVMLYCGVTGFLDLFSAEDQILSLRDRQRASGLLAADIYCSGPLLTCPGGHGTEYGIPTRVMRNPAEAEKMVNELAVKKPDVIKIAYDHAFTAMPSIDRPTMEAAVKAAKRHGIKTVIHIGTWTDAREAIEAGASSITHVHFGEEIPDAVAALMKARDIYEIPTLAVENDFLNFARDAAPLRSTLLMEVATPAIIAAYGDTSKLDARMRGWLRAETLGERYVIGSVRKMHEQGVAILAGTDAGNPGTFQGFSLHRELQLLVKAGLGPWDALAAATTRAGDFLGRDFGINPGAVANLVVLDASPIDDIANTQKIHAVIYHGAVVDRGELLHPKAKPWTNALIDDFSGNGRSASGAELSFDVDTAWGGSSTLKSERLGGRVRVWGTVTPNRGMPGTAGISLALDGGGAPADVSAYKGIRLTIKAPKGSLLMKLISDGVKNYDYHAAAIAGKPGEQTIELPFTSFRQLWSAPVPFTGKDLRGIAIWASGFQRGDYDFTIDSIELY